MLVKKKYIFFILLTIFVLFTMHQDVFERKFFFNEILTTLGIGLFLLNHVKNRKLIIPRINLFIFIFIFITIGIVYIFLSFPISTSIYYLFRNSVIVYSAFSFFVGYHSLEWLESYIKKIKKLLASYMLGVYLLGLTTFFNRYMGSVLSTFFISKSNILSIMFIIIVNIMIAFFYGQTTSIAIILLSLFIFINRSFFLFKVYIFSMVFVYFSLFAFFKPNLDLYKTGTYSLHGNMRAVVLSHPILTIDPNLTYRLVYQYRAIFEQFPQNILGIGFGTPIVNYEEGLTTSASKGHDDEYEAHVSGVHNTYVTVFLRMGVPYLILLVLIYHAVYKEFYKHKTYYNSNKQFRIFWAFTILSIFGLFNLMLETPTYASVYWILLGFITKAIYVRQSIQQVKTKSL